jgi:hypothetical protein
MRAIVAPENTALELRADFTVAVVAADTGRDSSQPTG